VLLHGLGATAALNWDACIPALARQFRVLAPDLRGHGRGIRCGANFRLADCADDVAALIRQEQRGPAIVVGYSMGGPIAQLLCHRHPDVVAGMVLCATSRDFRGSPGERAGFAALGLTGLASRLSPSFRPDRLGALRRDRLPGDLRELIGHEQRAILAAAVSLGTFTSRNWVADLAVPGVVVVTTRDRVVPVRRQQKLAKALDAPVVELDAGHLVPRTDPQGLAEAILDAARGLPKARARRRDRRRQHPRRAA
jgi:pimeloyl-ACP methyl ester carboxylesterase